MEDSMRMMSFKFKDEHADFVKNELKISYPEAHVELLDSGDRISATIEIVSGDRRSFYRRCEGRTDKPALINTARLMAKDFTDWIRAGGHERTVKDNPNIFDNIKMLDKRVKHFCGPRVYKFLGYEGPNNLRKKYGLVDWKSLIDRKKLSPSLLILLSNYELMLGDDDTHFERICWVDAFARAMNKWIDNNRVSDEPQAKLVLNWWRDNLLCEVQAL